MYVCLFVSLTGLGGRVDVLDGEHSAEPEQQHLGERGDQLRRRHQHVHTVLSVGGSTGKDIFIGTKREYRVTF